MDDTTKEMEPTKEQLEKSIPPPVEKPKPPPKLIYGLLPRKPR
jgi:hypothetical protein